MNSAVSGAIARIKNLPDSRLGGLIRSRLSAGKGGKKKWILLAAAAVLAVIAAVGIYRLFFAQEKQVPVTGTTTFGSLNETIEGSATTTPADSVTYEISGTVLEWNVEAGQEVKAGDLLYVLDSSDAEDEILEYEVNLEDLYEQRADIQESIANQRVTAPFSGRIENIQVEAGDDVQSGMTLAALVDDSAMKATLYFSYAYEGKLYTGMGVTLSIPDQMLTLDGEDTGSVVIYNQESMEISINVDELDVDYLEVGMPVTVYRSTSSGTVYYDGELTYLSLEATSGSSGVSTFAATLTNAGGTSQKYLYTMSYTNRYVGVALGQSAAGGTRIAAVQTLTSAKADAEDFFLQDGDWYVESGRQEYRVSDRVQIHLTEADLWLEGAEGLASVLADGYTLTLYYDRSADEGGQVRLITAQ